MLLYFLVGVLALLCEAEDKCQLSQKGASCKISLSAMTSALTCRSECFPKPYIVRINTTDTEITTANATHILHTFFHWTTTETAVSYVCEKEIIFTSSEYPISDDKCEENNTYFEELLDLQHVLQIDNITELEISHFNLKKVYAHHFPRISLLSINHNMFRKLEDIRFPNHVRRLYMTDNIVRDIFASDVTFSDSLEEIYFSGNKLYSVILAFKNFNNLKVLNISCNSLFNIRSLSFIGMPQLTALNLSHSNLSLAKIITFLDLPALRSLELNNNGIDSLSSQSFLNLTSLYFLDLSYNDLNYCYTFSEEEENDMQILNLSHNLIQHFENTCFRNMNKLRVLNISSNFIKELELCHLKSLEVLDASHNEITTVSCQDKINIRMLDLSYNKLISFLAVSHFSTRLELLLLDYNKIINTDFLKDSIHFLKVNHSVMFSLTFNKISTIDVSFMDTEKHSKIQDYLLNGTAKISIDISSNPMNCDGKAYHIKQYINKKINRKLYFLANSENIKCATPESLRNRSLLFLQDSEFINPIVDNCPQSCFCGIREFDKKSFVNCTNNQFLEAPTKVPSNVSLLDLNLNLLANLSSLNTADWVNLTHLWVDSNNLVTLDGWNIPINLQFLSVRINKLKTISKDLVAFIPNKRNFELYFGLNSRACDCDSKDFKQFLLNYPSKVMDKENIICDYKKDGKIISSALIEIQDSVLCDVQSDSNYNANFLIAILCSLILLVIVVAALYAWQRELIHSFLYVHCNHVINFYPDEISLKEAVYDAFVAYSSADTALVMELLNQLEQNEPFFKLCIHERDWMPGGIITETIVKSVRSSSRTIIVLSETFISSPWFKVELKAAISQEQMNPIIVIMTDQSTSLKELNKEFRDAISKRTYLVWGERWFWEKLRYALPHKVCKMN